MSTTKTKSRLVREAPTGAGRVRTASQVSSKKKDEDDTTTFPKPMFLSEKEEYKGSIHVIKNSGGPVITPIQNVIFTQIDWGKMESLYRARVQNGLHMIFLGENPTPLNMTLNLYNTRDHQWRDNFQWYYDYYLRGTALAKNDALAYVVLDGMIFGGAFTSARYVQTGDTPMMTSVAVQFEMDPRYARSLYIDIQGGNLPDEEIPIELNSIKRDLVKDILNGSPPGGLMAIEED